jgi:polysaccharide biosynthesis/export protein
MRQTTFNSPFQVTPPSLPFPRQHRRGLFHKRLLAGAAALTLAAGPAHAQPGEEAWGVRPLGLGKAYIGVADDDYAPFWNPAGMTRIQSPRSSFSFARAENRDGPAAHLASLSLVNTNSTLPGAAGFWWTRFDQGDVRRENVFALSYARDFYALPNGTRFAAGGSAKYMNQSWAGNKGADKSVIGLDAGLIYVPVNRLSFGLSVRNLNEPKAGPALGKRTPAEVGLGGSYWLSQNTMLALDAADIKKNGRLNLRGGMERWFSRGRWALRGGANESHLSGGLSLRALRMSAVNLNLDYAYNHPYDFSDHSRLHLVSLRVEMGGTYQEERFARRPPPMEGDYYMLAAQNSSSNSRRKMASAAGAAEESFSNSKPSAADKAVMIQRKMSMRLNSEDVLQINVRNHPELESVVTVDPWGYIKLPFIGDIKVAGLLKEDLEQQLEKIFSQFVRGPQVEVLIREYNSRVVYILGEVSAPGRYPMRDRLLTLRDAVVLAGLPTDRAALWRVFVIRQGDNGPVYKHINLSKVLYRGQLENNIVLQPGDIVFLPIGLLDGFVTFVGRIVGPIVGIGRNFATSTIAP